MEIIHIHDTVALTQPLPDHNLRWSNVGVVIGIGPNNQSLLEFADRNGVPFATPKVSTEGLMRVYLNADIVE